MGVLLEEVLIPTRFLTTAAHFVATITIAYDLVRMASFFFWREPPRFQKGFEKGEGEGVLPGFLCFLPWSSPVGLLP